MIAFMEITRQEFIRFLAGVLTAALCVTAYNEIYKAAELACRPSFDNEYMGRDSGYVSRGSIGRTEPWSINEQVAMEQVKADPLANSELVGKLVMYDRRWSVDEGWVKRQVRIKYSDGTKTVIHYAHNVPFNLFDDFKYNYSNCKKTGE